MTIEELNKHINSLEKNPKILRRLYFIIVTNLTFLTNGNRGERFSLVIFENMFVTVMKKTRLFTKSMVFDYKFRYGGHSVTIAAEMAGTSHNTGYDWQRRWNKEGYDGLKPKFGGGKPSKLSDEQKKDLVVKLKEKNNWTTQEVQKLIENEYDVEYSSKQIIVILRQFGMKYGKPYPQDYRRPENAEDNLKKNLEP